MSNLSKVQFTLHYKNVTLPKDPSDTWDWPESHRVEARKNGRVIGQLEVGQNRKGGKLFVEEVDVAKKYRRQGVATAMLKHMKDNGVEFTHSGSRTPEGDAFAKATSDIVPTPRLGQKVSSFADGPNKLRREF